MQLYNNLNYLIEKGIISGYKLAIESKIPQSTIVEIKTKNRELKGNQIYKIYLALKKNNLVSSLDQLFEVDLSKEQE